MSPTHTITIYISFVLFFLGLHNMAFGQSQGGVEADISKCWTYAHGSDSVTTFAVDSTRIYLGSVGGKVEAISLEGKKIWQSEFGGDIHSNLLPLDTGLLIVTSTRSQNAGRSINGTLRSISKETGITNWVLKLPDAASHHLTPDQTNAVVVSESGVVQSVDAKTGIVRWKKQIDQIVAEPVFNGTRVIVATDAKQLLAISLNTGRIETTRLTPFRTTAVVETAQRELIVGDERGNISLLSDSAAVEWKFRSGGEISRMIAVGTGILATSHDNFVYLLAGKSGNVEWKKRLTGRISQIGDLEGRYALISGIDEHGAVLTDLTNGKVAGQIAFDATESLSDEPMMSNGRIYVLTNIALYAYSLDGCMLKMQKAAP